MFNRYYPSVDDPYSSWKNYINTQSSLDVISSNLKTQNAQSIKQSEKMIATLAETKEDYINAMSSMSNDIVSSISECASLICDTLDEGFDLISRDINELCRTLDFRLSLILEQEVISNLISENIALLLRIPDIQKERQYYLEQGLKHLKNAFIDNEFYDNALENLLDAEKREKTDFVTLHSIGFIYLYSSKYLDLEKAESYFRRAGKFAKIETDPNATRLANIMTGSVLTKLANNITDAQKMKYVSAESYLQGAIACYIQKKFKDAAELAQIAFDLAPEMLEAGYYACLSNALIDEKELSIKYLNILVGKNSTFAVIAATDLVLAPRHFIQEWLTSLRKKNVNKALEYVDVLKLKSTRTSVFTLDLELAREKLYNSSFIKARRIIHYLQNELPIIDETCLYDKNVKNLSTIKTAIDLNNRCVSDLSRGSVIVNNLNAMDNNDIIKKENILRDDNPYDQCILTNEIFELKNKYDGIAKENLNRIIDQIDTLKMHKSEFCINRESKANEYNKSQKAIKIIGIVVSIILGFGGCWKTANSLDYGESIMDPFGSFFLYLIIGGVTFSAIILILKKVENNLRKISQEELDIEKDVTYLEDFINKYNHMINQLSNIGIDNYTIHYTPFDKYFV